MKPTKEELTSLLCDGSDCEGCINKQLSLAECEQLEENARLKIRAELEAMP